MLKHRMRSIKLVVLSVVFLMLIVLPVCNNIFLNDRVFPVYADPKAYKNFLERLAYADIDENIYVDINFFSGGHVFSKLNILNSTIGQSRISATIASKGRLIRNEKGNIIGVDGKLLSNDIAWNDQLLIPIRASLETKEGKVTIDSLKLGDSYSIRGDFSLDAPYHNDIYFEVSRADIRDFVELVDPENSKGFLGIISGAIHLRGTLNNLFSTGNFESRKGQVGPIGYDTAFLNFEGFGPMINIVDSRIRHGEGALTIEGYMDLRNIEKGGLFEGIKIKSDMKEIVWSGWGIKRKGSDRLSLSKDINENMRVKLKTEAREPLTNYRDEQPPEELSLEYKMGSENIKMMLKDNEEFFGIEHSMQF